MNEEVEHQQKKLHKEDAVCNKVTNRAFEYGFAVYSYTL